MSSGAQQRRPDILVARYCYPSELFGRVCYQIQQLPLSFGTGQDMCLSVYLGTVAE